VQRGAASNRTVSKRANFFGRMGLSLKHKADAAWIAGFLYVGGSYSTISFPGSYSSAVQGINISG